MYSLAFFSPTVLKQNELTTIKMKLCENLPNTIINYQIVTKPENDNSQDNIFPTENITGEDSSIAFDVKLSGTGTYKFNISGSNIDNQYYYYFYVYDRSPLLSVTNN